MKFQNIHEKVMEYIITSSIPRLSELTRYKIADEFCISQNYLSRYFKKNTNWTIFEFIEFEKMKRAEQLLITRGDLSVSDISEKRIT